MTAPTETRINEDLLRRVLEHITAHPDEHAQDQWAIRTGCDTAYCVAGHTVVMSGHQVDWDSARGSRVTSRVVGTNRTIGAVAADLLGIPFEHARDGLFFGENHLDDLWEIAAELTDGRVSGPSIAEAST